MESRARSTPDERFADWFASAFLMPRRAVLELLERAMHAGRGRFGDHDLVHLAMYFGASGQAMSLRLVRLRKLSAEVHDRYWRHTSTFKHLAEMLGYTVEDDLYQRPAVLPGRYRYLAFDAYQKDLISASKLGELLREEDLVEFRSRLGAAAAVVS